MSSALATEDNVKTYFPSLLLAATVMVVVFEECSSVLEHGLDCFERVVITIVRPVTIHSFTSFGLLCSSFGYTRTHTHTHMIDNTAGLACSHVQSTSPEGVPV